MGQPIPDSGEPPELRARLVMVVSDEDLPRYVVTGQAVAVTRQTAVVQVGERERAISRTPRTRLMGGGWPRVGDRVFALGQPTELGQWAAGVVHVPGGEQERQQGGAQGEIVALDPAAGTLTVQTARRGAVLVQTDARTRYRLPGVESPSLADFQVGDRVTALGVFEGEVLRARGVGIK